jgi:flagellin-like protein
MSETRTPRSRHRRFHRSIGDGRRLRSRRGVSDVVATIILLALTVVLFSAVFAFVTSFPAPPAQSSNQFQASLFYSSGSIAGLNITHLAGPQVPGGAQIYVKSAHNPTACFSTGFVLVSAGISSKVWNLGQTWSLPFANFTGCPAHTVDSYTTDNLTIYLLNGGNLLFTTVLPGSPFLSPPTIVATWTTPSPVTTGSAFKIYATVAGGIGTNKPYANLAGLPGQSGPAAPMWFNATNSAWQTNVSSVTTAGTYYVPINVTGTGGLTAAAAVSVTVSTSGSSSTSPSLSVIASVTPSPAFFRLPETLVATVTNSGSTSATVSSVNFWVNSTSCSSGTIVQGPTAGSTTPAVGAYSSAAVDGSSTWLPSSAANFCVSARVVFSSGAVATQASLLTVAQPFTASVAPSPSSVSAGTNVSFATVVSNDGPLAGTTAYVSLWVNYSSGSTHGTWALPTGANTPTSDGTGWWVSSSSGTALGAYGTLFWTPVLKSPTGTSTYSVTVSITLKNASWSSVYSFTTTSTVVG